MRVEGVNLDTFDLMAQDDVAAIIGKGRPAVNIGHDPVGRSQNRVGWFAMAVALQALDIEAFVHLAAVGANAAKRAGNPRLAGSGNEIAIFAARFKNGVV